MGAMMVSFLLSFVASPTYGVAYETEPSFIERSVKRKILFLDINQKWVCYTILLHSEHLSGQAQKPL